MRIFLLAIVLPFAAILAYAQGVGIKDTVITDAVGISVGVRYGKIVRKTIDEVSLEQIQAEKKSLESQKSFLEAAVADFKARADGYNAELSKVQEKINELQGQEDILTLPQQPDGR